MAKKQKATIVDPRTALVDEAVALQILLAPMADAIKRFDALKHTFRGWAEIDSVPAAESVLYLGAAGAVMVGPRENERKFKADANAAMFRALGQQKFLAACSMTLTAAAAALGEDKIALYVNQDRTGSRPLTVSKAA